ncbi:MAG: TM2 domain-containing protein [Ignavibacteriaceae bacterium]|nr:TM2 domain-containing protein [Ignavibacteriaceae bacterium]
MARVQDFLPAVSMEEMSFLEMYYSKFSDEQAREFTMMYSQKRKDAQTVLILTILGFFVAGGIQRFYLGQIGMGILYLFTYGLCLIGTIMDLVNNKSLTNEFNQKAAQEVAMMMRI